MTVTSDESPVISIIIPVLHEREAINSFLTNVCTLCSVHPFEVIVVDGSPTQETLKLITDKRIRLCSSVKGRGQQLNTGVAHATGDTLLFLHADTVLPSNALMTIQAILQDDRLVGGAFDVAIDSQKLIFKVFSRLI